MKNLSTLTFICFCFVLNISNISAQNSGEYKLISVDEKKVAEDTGLTAADADAKINWMSWEEALAANKTEKKKIFVDVYTDWCGWCKKMDASTFVNPEVVKYMNENFHAVKFNAEQKESIDFGGKTFVFKDGGRRGTHELAAELLNGRLGYPSFVLLNEDFARIRITPGFKQVNKLMEELTYAKDELYKLKTFEDFSLGL